MESSWAEIPGGAGSFSGVAGGGLSKVCCTFVMSSSRGYNSPSLLTVYKGYLHLVIAFNIPH